MKQIDQVAFDAARKEIDLRAKPISPNAKPRQLEALGEWTFEACKAAGLARFPVDMDMEFEYKDFYQEITNRRVRVNCIFQCGSMIFVNGYCHLRREYRTFNLHNINIDGNRYFLDHRGNILYEKIRDVFGINGDIHLTNFFINANWFHPYVKPIAILSKKARQESLNKMDILRYLFNFSSKNLTRGFWNGYYSHERAAAFAIVGMHIDVRNTVWESDFQNIKRFRFSRKVLSELVEEDCRTVLARDLFDVGLDLKGLLPL